MNSVGAKQIKRAAIDNTKVKKGSLLRSSFKKGQLPKGAKGAKGATGAIGLQGLAGLAGSGIKLGSFTHYVNVDVPGDSQWHDSVATTFTAVANTIYVPNDYADYRNASMTGTDCGNVATLFARTVVNGIDVTPVDVNGTTFPPQFVGPYPAGTSVTLQLQVKLTCATQTWHSPSGDLAMVPYQTS
jgi:hypothetical protein